jgi:hypothetical protein
MVSLSQKTKRLIIIWILIQAFALLVNYAGLNWKFEFESESLGIHGRSTDWIVYFIYPLTKCEGGQKDEGDNESFTNNKTQFWPFVTFYEESGMDYSANKYLINNNFNGFFYKYDFIEFFVYCLLPFIIISVKRLWK